MKKILLQSFAFILIISMFSCEEENSPIFVAQADIDGIEIKSVFAANYLISNETKDNIADRIIWDAADFGTATNVTYEIHGALDASFTSFDVIGTTNQNNYPILISNLLDYANQLDLDGDPSTTDSAGLPNNTGQMFIRVKATVGTADALETLSDFESINFTWIEITDTGSCDALYVLGEGITDMGWNFPGFEMPCEANVLKVKVRLGNAHFRFFTTIGDWNSGQDYTYYEDRGYAIDARLENVPAGDNFNFNGTPGIYTITIDNKNKIIDLKESSSLWAVGGAVPGGWAFSSDTVEFVENTPDIWSASITLSNEIFRFFQTFGTYDTDNNMTYYQDEGFTIDSNFENDGSGDGNFNFIGTPGTYTMTINAVNKIITLN
jgi:flavodoxin